MSRRFERTRSFKRQLFGLFALTAMAATPLVASAAEDEVPWIAVTKDILGGAGAKTTALEGNVIQPLEPSAGEREYDVYSGDFIALTYAASHAKYHFSDYAGDEFVYVQEGTVTVTDDGTGRAHTFKAGDFFVVPRGWKGIWSTPGPYREWILLGRDWGPFFAGAAVVSGVSTPVTAVPIDLKAASPKTAPIKFGEEGFVTPAPDGGIEGATLHDGDWAVMLIEQPKGGTYRYSRYPGDTYSHVVRGSMTLTDASGKKQTFGAGDDFIVTRTFRGDVRASPGYRALMVVDKKHFAASASAMAAAAVQLTDPGVMFSMRCAACHSLNVLAPTPMQLSRLTADEIEYALWHGTMMEFASGLDSGQRALLAEWIAGLGKEKGPRDAGVARCGTSASWQPNPASDWPGWSRDAGFDRFADDPGITAARMIGTRLKWALPLPVESAFEGAANPVAVVGNRIFTANNNRWVYALDPESGCAHWTYRAEGRIRSNVALEDGIIIFGDVYSNAYALDANIGRLLWRTRLDNSPGARVTGNVTLHRGVAYFPVSSHQELAGIRTDIPCCSFRGAVVAIDAKTGLIKWKTRTIEEPLHILGRTAQGANRYGPSGVPVWSGIAADDKRGVLYVSTGNQWTEPRVRESDSIIALDMATGRKRWVAALAPEEMGREDIYVLGCEGWIDPQRTVCSPRNPKGEGDRDFGAPAELATLDDGTELVLGASKDGMFNAVDPDTGNLKWKVRVGRGGDMGGVEYGFATDGRRAYLPVSDVDASNFKADGSLVAVDLRTGKIVWRTKGGTDTCQGKPTPPCNNAFLSPSSVAGEVVIAGTSDGILHAYSKADGRELWSFDSFRSFTGANGLTGSGGSFGFGGPTVAGKRIYIMSGHSYLGVGMPGNVLLSFEIP